MDNWEHVLIKIVLDRGGTATTQEIYEALESGRFLVLDAAHLRETIYGGRPAYQHAVRSYLSNLVQKGELVRVGRGIYSVSK